MEERGPKYFSFVIAGLRRKRKAVVTYGVTYPSLVGDEVTLMRPSERGHQRTSIANIHTGHEMLVLLTVPYRCEQLRSCE